MIANTNSPSSSNSTPVLLISATTRTPKMFSSVITTQRAGRDPLLVGQRCRRPCSMPMSLSIGISVSGSVATHGGHGQRARPQVDPAARTRRTASSARGTSSTGTPSRRSGSGVETSAKFSATMNCPSATTGHVQMNAPAERAHAEDEQREDARGRRDVAERRGERAEEVQPPVEALLVAELARSALSSTPRRDVRSRPLDLLDWSRPCPRRYPACDDRVKRCAGEYRSPPPWTRPSNTLDELRNADRRRSGSTPSCSRSPTCRAACRASACTRAHFLDEVAEHGAEALQLPARRRRRDEHRRRLRDVVVGARLRRLRDDARTSTRCGRVPWHEGTALCLADVAVGRRLAGRRLAAPDPARASSSGSPSAAGRAYAGTELEFIVFRDTYEEAWHKGYRDLDAGQPLQRRLLAARHRARRAADPPHPQRDGRRRAWSVEDSKGECNFGQHEINFRYADALRDRRRARRSTRTAPRRSPPRRAWRSRSWPSSTSARATRATSTSRCATTTARRCSPTSAQLFDALPRRPARLPARADAAARAERQLLQALRRGLVRADRGRLGHATTARARCASSATAPALRIECRVPGADVNPYLALAR